MSMVASARRLDPLQWLGIPLVLCLVCTVLFAVPLRVFGLRLPQPVFAMVPAFAWAAIRPSVFAAILLMGVGLFLDLFWGGPAGLWMVALLIAYGMVLAIRPTLTGRGVVALWAWYAVACALAYGVGVLVIMVKDGAPPNPLPLGLNYLITLLLYPFAHRLIERFEDADVRFR